MAHVDAGGAGRAAVPGRAKAPVVLVIDDSATMSQYIEKILTSIGYEVDLAANGADGLARVLERTPQLIVLDMQMPQIDGIGVLKRLKNRPPYDRIPVIVLTAGQSLDGVMTACSLGAKDYMTKPFEPASLIEKALKHAPVRGR